VPNAEINTDDVDPLGAYTPEVDEALRAAHDAITASAETRKSADKLLETVKELEQTVWKTVNSGLTRKVSETAKVKVSKPPKLFELHGGYNVCWAQLVYAVVVCIKRPVCLLISVF